MPMRNHSHLYVSRNNGFVWLALLCLAASGVSRILFAGAGGSGGTYLLSQVLLPVAAVFLYGFITWFCGQELFYKTAIPVWMMALYAGVRLQAALESRLMLWLFWIALAFFALLYTLITAGTRHPALFLLPVISSPLVFLLYVYRHGILQMEPKILKLCLPDILAVLGVLVVIFALRIHPANAYHPTWGDRTDGRRIRTLPPLTQVVPYLMVHRNESSNLFEDSIEISQMDRYIRRKRREGLTSFGVTHVLLAAYCRSICKYPGLNRFLSGQRVYSRGDDIQFCMTIKKEMTTEAPDTVIKLHLNPRDTADDVYRKFQEAVEQVKSTPLDSAVDNTAGALNLIPGVVLKFLVWLLKLLDYFGMLPQFLLEVSPFHGSLFLTSMGSLGIPPIYHHLYNFGNLPVFGAFGIKRRACEVLEDGTVVLRKYIDLKFTLDERIADGFYYAAFFKHYKRLLRHPEVLDHPPESVLPDID